MATNENNTDAKIQFGKDPKEMNKDEFVQLLKDIKDGTVTPAVEILTTQYNGANSSQETRSLFLPAPNGVPETCAGPRTTHTATTNAKIRTTARPLQLENFRPTSEPRPPA